MKFILFLLAVSGVFGSTHTDVGEMVELWHEAVTSTHRSRDMYKILWDSFHAQPLDLWYAYRDDKQVNEHTLHMIENKLAGPAKNFFLGIMSVREMDVPTRELVAKYDCWETVGEYPRSFLSALSLLRTDGDGWSSLLKKQSVREAAIKIIERFFENHGIACDGRDSDKCATLRSVLGFNWFSRLWTVHRLQGDSWRLSQLFPEARFDGAHLEKMESLDFVRLASAFINFRLRTATAKQPWEEIMDFIQELTPPTSAKNDKAGKRFADGINQCADQSQTLECLMGFLDTFFQRMDNVSDIITKNIQYLSKLIGEGASDAGNRLANFVGNLIELSNPQHDNLLKFIASTHAWRLLMLQGIDVAERVSDRMRSHEEYSLELSDFQKAMMAFTDNKTLIKHEEACFARRIEEECNRLREIFDFNIFSRIVALRKFSKTPFRFFKLFGFTERPSHDLVHTLGLVGATSPVHVHARMREFELEISKIPVENRLNRMVAFLESCAKYPIVVSAASIGPVTVSDDAPEDPFKDIRESMNRLILSSSVGTPEKIARRIGRHLRDLARENVWNVIEFAQNEEGRELFGRLRENVVGSSQVTLLVDRAIEAITRAAHDESVDNLSKLFEVLPVLGSHSVESVVKAIQFMNAKSESLPEQAVLDAALAIEDFELTNISPHKRGEWVREKARSSIFGLTSVLRWITQGKADPSAVGLPAFGGDIPELSALSFPELFEVSKKLPAILDESENVVTINEEEGEDGLRALCESKWRLQAQDLKPCSDSVSSLAQSCDRLRKSMESNPMIALCISLSESIAPEAVIHILGIDTSLTRAFVGLRKSRSGQIDPFSSYYRAFLEQVRGGHSVIKYIGDLIESYDAPELFASHEAVLDFLDALPAPQRIELKMTQPWLTASTDTEKRNVLEQIIAATSSPEMLYQYHHILKGDMQELLVRVAEMYHDVERHIEADSGLSTESEIKASIEENSLLSLFVAASDRFTPQQAKELFQPAELLIDLEWLRSAALKHPHYLYNIAFMILLRTDRKIAAVSILNGLEDDRAKELLNLLENESSNSEWLSQARQSKIFDSEIDYEALSRSLLLEGYSNIHVLNMLELGIEGTVLITEILASVRVKEDYIACRDYFECSSISVNWIPFYAASILREVGNAEARERSVAALLGAASETLVGLRQTRIRSVVMFRYLIRRLNSLEGAAADLTDKATLIILETYSSINGKARAKIDMVAPDILGHDVGISHNDTRYFKMLSAIAKVTSRDKLRKAYEVFTARGGSIAQAIDQCSQLHLEAVPVSFESANLIEQFCIVLKGRRESLRPGAKELRDLADTSHRQTSWFELMLASDPQKVVSPVDASIALIEHDQRKAKSIAVVLDYLDSIRPEKRRRFFKDDSAYISDWLANSKSDPVDLIKEMLISGLLPQNPLLIDAFITQDVNLDDLLNRSVKEDQSVNRFIALAKECFNLADDSCQETRRFIDQRPIAGLLLIKQSMTFYAKDFVKLYPQLTSSVKANVVSIRRRGSGGIIGHYYFLKEMLKKLCAFERDDAMSPFSAYVSDPSLYPEFEEHSL